MTYKQLSRRAVGNLLLGTVISIVPGFAFYWLAFEHTAAQIRILSWLAIPAVAAFLAVDLVVLAAVLRPVRQALAPEASGAERARGAERLLALPKLVLPRIFGPHAVSATLAFNLLVLWANRTLDLGIPESRFPLYWLLNLTVIPVGHVVYEYHATERLIVEPLGKLLAQARGERLAVAQATAVRAAPLPLAWRIFLFSALLGLAPVVVGGFITYQRARAAGLVLPVGFFFQLSVVGAALALLWVLLLLFVSREVGEQTRGITAALLRIAGGDLSAEAPLRSTSEFGLIALAVNQMTAGLRERQRLKQEVLVAREIQQALLPQRFPRFAHFEVVGTNRSSLEVGGDYLDAIALGPDRLAFVIADVCGKGLGAALVTALVQGTFSAMMLEAERERVFAHINRFICAHSSEPRFATLFFGLLDARGRLEVVNAGHLPPLVARDGRVEYAFPAGSVPLGLFPEEKFQATSATLAPGDTLVLYTDGLTEAVNPAGEQFGQERLQELVARRRGASVEELQADILAAVEEFTRGASLSDDLTLLIVRYRGTG